jgi:putative hemolysin
MQELPTLIKSYLRLGAFIGEGAVIDWQFKTIDVCIMLPTINIPKKYYSYF